MFIKGYDQKTLATKVAISETYLSFILNNKKQPSVIVAKKLSKVLGSPIEDLFTLKKVEKHEVAK